MMVNILYVTDHVTFILLTQSTQDICYSTSKHASTEALYMQYLCREWLTKF